MTDAAQMKIRLPRRLKEWVSEQAKANGRSLNAEIWFRLEIARMGLQPRPETGGTPAAGQGAQT